MCIAFAKAFFAYATTLTAALAGWSIYNILAHGAV